MDGTSGIGKSVETGALLPVLQRASHDDLREIARSINKALDVFITRDDRFWRNRHDLTNIPEVIGEYLLRAGGHAVMNWWRGSGPSYSEVVRDVCSAFKVKLEVPKTDVIGMELAFLQKLLSKLLKRLTNKQKADLLLQMKEAAGRPVSMDDLLKGTTLLGLLMPIILTIIAQQAVVDGLVVGAEVVLGRVGASMLGPIGFVAGAAWLVADIAGPSLRGTIPAVAQVALLRQRMLFERSDV